MTTADLLNDYNGKFAELSKLIKSWNLMNVISISELDKLTAKILNKLYEEQAGIKIKQTSKVNYA